MGVAAHRRRTAGALTVAAGVVRHHAVPGRLQPRRQVVPFAQMARESVQEQYGWLGTGVGVGAGAGAGAVTVGDAGAVADGEVRGAARGLVLQLPYPSRGLRT